MKEKTMLKKFVLGLLAIAVLAGFVHAHGDPIMGTVTAVKADTFTIKDMANKPVTLMLAK